jgi:hypothetical protein
MLDDNRRKAVAAVRDFCHRVNLPAVSLPRHPVILTKPGAEIFLDALDRRRCSGL